MRKALGIREDYTEGDAFKRMKDRVKEESQVSANKE